MRPFNRSLLRVWQPRRALFWLVLAASGLSSLLVIYIQAVQPTGGVRWMLSLVALGDTLLGWWLLQRLWRENGPASDPTSES